VPVVAAFGDQAIISVLQNYLLVLQRHPAAEEMMPEVVTEDFETGFSDGFVWKGLEGLRAFLSQRDGFFDEMHTIEALLDRGRADNGDVEAKTRLRFFLRSWQSPWPVSKEFTGLCYHTWRLRDVDGRWRVAAQLVDRFEDLNDNAERLFATPDTGLNR
jgi:hypothetical protein